MSTKVLVHSSTPTQSADEARALTAELIAEGCEPATAAATARALLAPLAQHAASWDAAQHATWLDLLAYAQEWDQAIVATALEERHS